MVYLHIFMLGSWIWLHQSIYLFLCQEHIILMTKGLCYNLKFEVVALANWGLVVPHNFWLVSFSCKEQDGAFDWNCTESNHAFM